MSELSLDLENFRAMTGGDKAFERYLFGIFVEEAQACLTGLDQALSQQDSALWHEKAHAFKGICANLGANKLALFCKTAQNSAHEAPYEAKQAMLDEIKAEYEVVAQLMSMDGAA